VTLGKLARTSDRTGRTGRAATWLATGALLIATAACSGGSSSSTGATTPVGQATAGGSTASSGATASKAPSGSASKATGKAQGSAGTQAAPKPLRPKCSMLARTEATKLVGGTVTARTADVRSWPAGTSQLDGCAYLGSTGHSLQYVVWSTKTAASTTPPPIPGNAPATRFNPGVGQTSTGLSVTAGGRTTVDVTAAVSGRLVQVTAVSPVAADARRAAVEAARSLITAR